MSEQHSSHDDIQKHVKVYLYIFGALLIGTVITVLASRIHFGSHSMNIAVAMVIASVKAFLVAGYFMHLISERKMIYSILVTTVFFLIGLMFLTIWSMDPSSLIHFK